MWFKNNHWACPFSPGGHSLNFPWGRGIPNAVGISGGSLTALLWSNFGVAALLRFSNLSSALCSCRILLISWTHLDSPRGWPRIFLMNWGFLFRVASYRSGEGYPWYLTPREPVAMKKGRQRHLNETLVISTVICWGWQTARKVGLFHDTGTNIYPENHWDYDSYWFETAEGRFTEQDPTIR